MCFFQVTSISICQIKNYHTIPYACIEYLIITVITIVYIEIYMFMLNKISESESESESNYCIIINNINDRR